MNELMRIWEKPWFPFVLIGIVAFAVQALGYFGIRIYNGQAYTWGNQWAFWGAVIVALVAALVPIMVRNARNKRR